MIVPAAFGLGSDLTACNYMEIKSGPFTTGRSFSGLTTRSLQSLRLSMTASKPAPTICSLILLSDDRVLG